MRIFKKTKKEADDLSKRIGIDKGGVFLIKQPWITEKNNNMMNLRKYVFLVDPKANKSEISKNIESSYNVKVSSVNVVNIKGKTKRIKGVRGRISGKRKAIITLKEGYKIETMSV